MSVIPMSVKLKVLELKIEKRKGDLVKEGRELFLGDDQARKMSMLDNYLTTEFDGLAMDGKSLEIISKFLPKLEELHLDGVFLETKIFKEMREKAESIHDKGRKTASNIKRQFTITSEAEKYKKPDIESDTDGPWVAVSKAILDASESKRKLKCFSINGCQIDDSNFDCLQSW